MSESLRSAPHHSRLVVARVALFALGALVGVAVVWIALALFDEYRTTESNILIGLTIAAAIALVRKRQWRAFGVGLLFLMALYVLAAALLLIWASQLPIS